MKRLTYIHNGYLALEHGGRLSSPAIAYQQWGEPLPDGSNVVWVIHALTANADVFDWWPGLFGPNDFFNPDQWCIICANNLASCYGSTGPLSNNPETGKPYHATFPDLTIRDLVNAHRLLSNHLGISKIAVVIGGSMGGQQALEWAVQDPDRFEYAILMATNAVHSPWGIAFNESQRMAIEADGSWGTDRDDAGLEGMKAARSMALLSYRHYGAYAKTQSPKAGDDPFLLRAVSYQRYQGEKLARRFNAYSYHALTKIMDSQDLSRGCGSVEEALASVKATTLVLGIETDLLFPPAEQQRIAKGIPNGQYAGIDSLWGHDGFLLEMDSLCMLIGNFLKGHKIPDLKPGTWPKA
jgi:homoserine O-acetyltransferase